MRSSVIYGLFLTAQFFDGVLTYLGIARFGVGVEANPIVGWYVMTLGAGPALIAAKGFALACGGALYLLAMRRTLGVLTAIYVAAAVLPWLHLLLT